MSSRSWFEGLDSWRERRLGAGISVPTGRGNLTPADVDDRILNRLEGFLFPRRCVAFICLIGKGEKNNQLLRAGYGGRLLKEPFWRNMPTSCLYRW